MKAFSGGFGMKKAFLAVTMSLGLSAAALGAYFPAPQEQEKAMTKRWFCTADGYDWNGKLQQVSGDYAPTEAEAVESAVAICRSWGYGGCMARSCFQF